MATTRTAITEAQLMALPRDGRKYELVDGDIQASPAGMHHGEVIVELTTRLHALVKEQRLGRVFDSSTGFRMLGGNVRSPDVSFLAGGRLPEGASPEGFGELAPDLAIEVLSPGDDEQKVFEKIGEYLAAGVRLVWVINPGQSCATAYRSLTQTRQIVEDGFLDGEDVVPGFRCRLGDILGR